MAKKSLSGNFNSEPVHGRGEGMTLLSLMACSNTSNTANSWGVKWFSRQFIDWWRLTQIGIQAHCIIHSSGWNLILPVLIDYLSSAVTRTYVAICEHAHGDYQIGTIPVPH